MARRTITTDATGRREARPDSATVEVTAIGEGDTAAEARRSARDRAASVRESLAEVVHSADRIHTVERRIEDSSQAFDPDTDAPFRAVERLRVDCAPEAASEVVVAATDAGGTVRSTQFGVDEEVSNRLQEEALAAAMERARAKAERIAASEGFEVGGVREVTTGDDAGMSSIVDEALAANRDLEIHPGPVAVTETVEVVYELADD